jgi:uncharacterized protein YecT (DUF1311 family)
MVVVATAWFCSTAQGALKRPTLPVKAAPNSLASLPCPRNPISTVAIEVCEGHKQLRLDRQFNKLTAALWPILDATARAEFVSAHRAWLTYRDEECAARARAALGGTAAGPIFAVCETEMTRARVKELAGVVSEYCNGRVRTGPHRGCPHS